VNPTHLPPALYVVLSLAGAGAMLIWRYRETSTPVTLPKLIMPPLGMSTGLLMFIAPEARVPWHWGLGAFLLGAVVFSIPLARSSTLTREGDTLLMKRSPLFLVLLLGLVAVRFALRSWIEVYWSQLQTGALFFLLALGAVARWRLGLVMEFRRLSR
jgi:membrane protein CcdC involved in cytochrome C biogenesis